MCRWHAAVRKIQLDLFAQKEQWHKNRDEKKQKWEDEKYLAIFFGASLIRSSA